MVPTEETLFSAPMRGLRLKVFPAQQGNGIRAWDAADHYALAWIERESWLKNDHKPLIINDSWGALGVALGAWRVTLWGDSYIAKRAFEENWVANGWSEQQSHFISSTVVPKGPWRRIILRVPKNLALLEHQLSVLVPQLAPDAELICLGMAKHWPKRVADILEQYFGPVQHWPQQKKARLSSAQVRSFKRRPTVPPHSRYELPGAGIQLVNLANTFSSKQIDIGTRFFLPHLPKLTEGQRVVDLGCGNGALGLSLALQQPRLHLTLVDESYMAVESARLSFQAAGLSGEDAVGADYGFQVADGMAEFAVESVDKVVCNPPFHQQHRVGDDIAWGMFRQAYRGLVKGGELWIVGNRHLNYHVKLKRLFGGCQLVASNNKFVVLRAQKR